MLRYDSRLDLKLSLGQKNNLRQIADQFEYESLSALIRAIANKRLIVTKS
ncbi:hypothetical protein [Leptolyngbya sp. FACHB-17]|nr:hypothetical protein [Leptolyngbya sp. FACHB-17]MBD2079596.1 hypothetical protein [Leptolyngbya sp. FACHB-17]